MEDGIHLVDGQFVVVKKIKKEDAGKLLRDFLKSDIGLSRTAMTAIKKNGNLAINGEHVTVRYILKEKDELHIVFPKESESPGLVPEAVPLNIIYEEPAFLVVNKPAELQTVPSMRDWRQALANGILYYLKKAGLESTAHMVTRLDRDTTGLVLVAKHGFFHEAFTRMRKSGRLSREYIAIIHGHLPESEGTIDAPIGRKDGSIIERCVREDGDRAVTHYKVLKETMDDSVVSVKLDTGRTHQIRVHFSYLGHPLVGDDLYGGKRDDIQRQALHCHRLRLYSPVTEVPMIFTAPLPEDMRRLI
ncbi:MAG: RluA family pseudouridine synthase [Tuberibacillus sp.]